MSGRPPWGQGSPLYLNSVVKDLLTTVLHFGPVCDVILHHSMS